MSRPDRRHLSRLQRPRPSHRRRKRSDAGAAAGEAGGALPNEFGVVFPKKTRKTGKEQLFGDTPMSRRSMTTTLPCPRIHTHRHSHTSSHILPDTKTPHRPLRSSWTQKPLVLFICWTSERYFYAGVVGERPFSIRVSAYGVVAIFQWNSLIHEPLINTSRPQSNVSNRII